MANMTPEERAKWPYMSVRYADLHDGDKLIADGGFTCLREDQEVTVHGEGTNAYVECDEGSHTLDGQADFDEPDFIVGFRRPEPAGATS